MIRIILISLIAPGCSFLTNVIFRINHNWWRYAALFFFVFIFMLFNWTKAEAYELSSKYKPGHHLHYYAKKIESQYRVGRMSDSNRAKYEALEKEHLEKAYQDYTSAQERCMWIPNIQDKIKAEYCFGTAMSMLSATNPMSKVVVTVMSLATIYGIHVIREWNEINTLLLSAQYHYEMQEFYTDVLKQYK